MLREPPAMQGSDRLKFAAVRAYFIETRPTVSLPHRCLMTRKRLAVALAAITLAAGVGVTASPAEAQWRRGGYGWHGGYGYHRGYGYRGVGPGAIVGGALLGLGVGALLAAPYAAAPPVVYAPPPPAYYPPAYYPPAYAYAPAPAYYPPYYR